jgi:hypothetical protein
VIPSHCRHEGVELSLSTLADQVGACAAVLRPLHALIEEHVLSAERLHGDDTTVPMLAKGKTDTGRAWVYVRDDRPFGGTAPPAALFHASRDRSGDHPERHLAAAHAMILAERAARVEAEALAARAAAVSSGTEALIARLRLEIEKLRRELYGSRSERKARLLEQMEAAARGSGGGRIRGRARCREGGWPDTQTVRSFERKRPSRKPFPEHLPRERVVIAAPENCPCCGSTRLSKLGEDAPEAVHRHSAGRCLCRLQRALSPRPEARTGDGSTLLEPCTAQVLRARRHRRQCASGKDRAADLADRLRGRQTH